MKNYIFITIIIMLCGTTNASTIAHRGTGLLAPENTFAAFAFCSNKADMVEFDVRESSDEILVIMHDSTVDRTTDGSGTVVSKTLAELKTLDAGSWFSSEFSGEKIPTLTGALNAILPVQIPLIEHKAGSASNYVQTLQNLNMITNVVIQSFDWNFLDDVHSIDTNIELAALGSGTLTMTIITNLKTRGINTIAWSKNNITLAEVDMVHSNGMKIFVWTINDSTIRDFLDLGVDGIISDDPVLVNNLADDSPSGFQQLASNIISYWKFDDGLTDINSTEVNDQENNNPGTLNGFDAPPSWTNSMHPQFGGALFLDGINDYVDIPNSVSLNINTNSLSMSMWVKLPKKPSQIENFGGIFDSESDAYVIYLDKNNAEIRFKVTDVTGNAARPGIPEANIQTGIWHNIVAVFDGSAGPVSGQALIYLDGHLMDIHTGNNGTARGLDKNVKSGQHATIGRNGAGASYWQSSTVDDIAIWNRRLSHGEALQIFNSGTNGIPLSKLLIPEPMVSAFFVIGILALSRRKL